jgi:hypothetical protein
VIGNLVVGKLVKENPENAPVGRALEQGSRTIESDTFGGRAKQRKMEEMRGDPQGRKSKRRKKKPHRAFDAPGGTRQSVAERAPQEGDRNVSGFAHMAPMGHGESGFIEHIQGAPKHQAGEGRVADSPRNGRKALNRYEGGGAKDRESDPIKKKAPDQICNREPVIVGDKV